MNPRTLLGPLLIVIGLILVLDELWLFGVPFGGFLGDWSWLHLEPFHHWMLGVAMVVAGVVLARGGC